MTEAATVEKPAEELVISDGSHLAENAKGAITKALNKVSELIVRVPGILKESAEVFAGISGGRVAVRRNILLEDNEPDWAGKSQLYKHTVHQGEKEAMSVLSDDDKKTLDSNVRSHTRRTVLEPVIVTYAMEVLGLTGKTPEPSDSPALAKEVRRQYDRAKLAVPDRWKSDPGEKGGPGNDAIETPVSKVLAGAIALKEIPSVVERIGYVHKMLSDMLADICQPNAVVTGGRQSAAKALAEVANLSTTGWKILDGALTGEELEAVRAKFEKHLYQD